MDPAAWSMNNSIGRLVEVRIKSLPDPAEVQRFWRRFADLAAGLPAAVNFVICTDVQTVTVLPPEVADLLLAGMLRDNPRLERNGMLLGPGALVLLQAERLIREAQSPRRRSFREPEGLVRWLDEVLSEPERAALRRFLGLA